MPGSKANEDLRHNFQQLKNVRGLLRHLQTRHQNMAKSYVAQSM